MKKDEHLNFNAKQFELLAELMKLCVDFNAIESTLLHGPVDIEKEYAPTTKTTLDDGWDWYYNSGEAEEGDNDDFTRMRFCMTLGIGGTWLYFRQKDKLAESDIFTLLSEPRGSFEMDEYIEDLVGIRYPKNSYSKEDELFCRLIFRMLSIVKKYYNLDDREEEQKAGEVMFILGCRFETTRILREDSRTEYDGDELIVHNLVSALIEDFDNDSYINLTNEILRKRVERTFFYVEKDGKLFEHTYANYHDTRDTIRVHSYKNEDKKTVLINTIPILDSNNVYAIVIDKVHEWSNGVEATIYAHLVESPDTPITFYDTHYLQNKDRYIAGRQYVFDLYGIAFNIEVTPDDKRSITLSREAAERFRNEMDITPEYDEEGNIKPFIMSLKNMRAFLQGKDNQPTLVEFHSPIKRSLTSRAINGNQIKAIEIAIAGHTDKDEDTDINLKIFARPEIMGDLESYREDEPVQGLAHLQGRMLFPLNLDDLPTDEVHSLMLTNPDGTNKLVTHECDEKECGAEMSNEECKQFAIEMYKSRFEFWKIDESKLKTFGYADLAGKNNRLAWIRPNRGNCTPIDAIQKEEFHWALITSYVHDLHPVYVYVSLLDESGKETSWVKGGQYYVRFDFLSLYPGQKNQNVSLDLTHDDLIECLHGAYVCLDLSLLKKFIHKDLDFRSENYSDILVTREEYLYRARIVNSNNRKAKEGPLKSQIVEDPSGNYIELTYPNGDADIVTITTHEGLITSISIKNKL